MSLFGHWLFWLASLSLAGWLYLIFWRGAFWRGEALPDPSVPSGQRLPEVIAVVPARNEAPYLARTLHSLIAQDYPGRVCVIVVDDSSEDLTHAIAEATKTRPDHLLEVIGARPRPAGWSGKLWAVSEGLQRGFERMPDAPYVLLTDADVQHDPGNVRRLVAKAEADRLDLVSLMFRLHCQQLWERLLIPPFVFFFRELYPFAAVNRQQRAEAAANGGCILVRREALRRIGGIESIHDRLIDDIALAQRIKHYPTPGTGRIWLGLDIRLVMSEGSIKYVHAVSHKVRDVSARRALRALIDVTAAREADAALRRAQSELAHASRMTALGELTTSIAHEVNQPLAAIVTNGQACLRWLARDVPFLDEARGAVTRIIADADRASEVIRRIRALARKSDTKKARLNLNDVIDEVILLVRHEVSSHRISLLRELASGLPPVLGDQVQLQQVLINLVINGIQAMATVIDRPRELLIRSRQEADQILVAVRDFGIGIAPEKMSQVFDTFVTTKADGMGMGLSICRSIIEAHGGQVWASSNDGPGVTFQLTLPSVQPNSL